MNKALFLALAVISNLCGLANSQERYELATTNATASSTVMRTDAKLQVVGADGKVTEYQREPRFDSTSGEWLGYYSREANQIVRWPIANSGNLQIGSMRGNSIEYRTSLMQIHALDSSTPERFSQRPDLSRPILPPSDAERLSRANPLGDLTRSEVFASLAGGQVGRNASAELLHIVSMDRAGSPWLLSRGSNDGLSCIAGSSAQGSDWWVAPAEGGYLRIQSYRGGRVFAISTTRANALAMQPLSQDARQLWRVVGGRGGNGFALVNGFNSGQCLTHTGGGHLMLAPINFAPAQMWVPYAAPIAPAIEPFWRSVSREIHANPQLPPALLELRNSQRHGLVVLLGDIRKGEAFETIRVAPGSSATVSLDRDAGATIVETIEIRSTAGVWNRQELVTAIPATAFYDLSVYEEHLQSIAIDRTGKSPNPIEDVNYVPKSVGWLPLPAGPELPPHGQLDVHARAKSANNPGAVRRMDPKQFDDPPPASPLESILKEYQSAPRKSF